MNSDQDNFTGINYIGDDQASSASRDTDKSYRYGIGGDTRIAEAADVGRSSYSGFASDSMFNSGGGYSPSGIDTFQSGAAQSAPGIFGNRSASIITPTINSSVRLGSTPSVSTYKPASSSLSIDRRDDSGLSTPRTLSW